MMRALRRATSGLLVLIAGCPLAAQETLAVEVGGAVVRFPEDERWLAGPWMRVVAQRDVLAIRFRGETALVVSGTGASGSAQVAASHLQALGWHGLAWDADGEAGALFGNVSHASESVVATARLLLPVGDGAIRVGGTTHLANRESGLLRGHGAVADAWWRLPGATVLASLTREWAQGQLFAGSTRDFPIGVVPVQYVEATAGLSAVRTWGTLNAIAGFRRDPGAEQHTEALWSLGALVHASERMDVTLGVSRQPADFVRGADAAQSVSIGLRIATGDASRTPRARVVTVAELVSATEGPARTLRIRAPGARVVEVMGDFTGWEPVALAATAGDFLLAEPLTPGPHRLLVRLDGGVWAVPANTPAVDDDFGGRVGLLVVP